MFDAVTNELVKVGAGWLPSLQDLLECDLAVSAKSVVLGTVRSM